MRRNVLAKYIGVWALVSVVGCLDTTSENQQLVSDDAPDAVLAWNATAASIIIGPGGAAKVPPLALVDLAIVHVAIYDAVNAADGFDFQVYAVRPQFYGQASDYAAAAQAAHDTLLAMYPNRQADLDAALATSLGFVRDCRDKQTGIDIGKQVAAGILALRSNDNRNAPTEAYTTAGGPGQWVPTPPGFLPAQAPQTRHITPFTMSSPSQFRTDAPPALDSQLWIDNYNEIKALGNAGPNTRTPEQTDIGRFWGDNPVLQWNRAWRTLSTARGLSLKDNARYFAMLATASSDSLIACWDSKYFWGFWRPDTAIPAGGGNPALVADPNWISLVVTPNHPEYPAAHGCFSGASTATLRSFFRSDGVTFTIDSKVAGLTSPVRTYSSFTQAIQEVQDARVYGGMHYRNSTNKGRAVGEAVASQMTANFFRRLR
jgi:PAP2 superfamily protein